MILVGQSALSLHDFSEIIFNQQQIALDAAALDKVKSILISYRNFRPIN